MNFVHIADIHFDMPFTVISDRAGFGDERRLEQRQAFKNVIEFVKENNVEYLFISGDLYEHEYIRKSTVEYINSLFKQIPNTKIYIAPGNHDPYIRDSYYATYKWNSNVTIFKEKVQIISSNNLDIYGYGFNDFEMYDKQLENLIIENPNKINILITHGDLYTASKYNFINVKILDKLNFNYVAIGHIHKRDEIYLGSLISLGFDELGEHGFIYGEFANKKLKTKFISSNQRQFVLKDLDVSEIYSEEELVETINEICDTNDFYKINLIGFRNFIININYRLVKENVIKIKNYTKIKNDYIQNSNTLKGIFIKNVKEKLNNKEITENQYEKILEIGISSLEKNK